MSLTTTTHLNFRGEARAALAFYRAVFGGDLLVVTYGEAGVPVPETDRDTVLWGQVTSLSGFSVMAYDVPAHLPHARGENSFFVSLRGTDADEIARHWAGLAQGATIRQALGPAPWSPLYGMLEDRFGIVWVLDLGPAASAA